MRMILRIMIYISILSISCTSKSKHENYIDITIQTSREYTPEERAKIREALKRFNENVEIVDNQYLITAKSGDEIGIPNEFFYIFKMGIDDTNDLIRESDKDWELAEPN